MQNSYDTLTEALNDLHKRGYKTDFNLKLKGPDSKSHIFNPENYVVEEVYRFEGMSDPDDNSVVYAIKSKEGIKGVMVDAYGVYAEALTHDISRRLRDRVNL